MHSSYDEPATPDTVPGGDDAILSAAERDYDATQPPANAGMAGGPTVPPDPFNAPPPELPTQEGPMGVRYDFNDGARVFLPQGQWHVRIEDDESGNILFDCDADEGWVVSTKKYYVPFRILVWDRDTPEPILDHTMDLFEKEVLVKFPVGTVGDLVGWFPYAEKFRQKHDCIMECIMGRPIIDLVAKQYPDISFSEPGGQWMKEPYASYRVGLFFGGNLDFQPVDFRMVGLHRTAGHILGVDPAETPPLLDLSAPRPIEEPYVCIAAKSTAQAKYWNNGYGWSVVVEYLKSIEYRVICIDRSTIVGQGWIWNQLPLGAEDFTGMSLTECVPYLHHADFFIGLSSGLSWLAWAAGAPVILISGFSLPLCEFETPYRVYNTHGCRGCWDDITLNFDHNDFFWCPRHKGTDRQFECTRLITGRQVIGHIKRLMRDKDLAAPHLR